MQTLRRGDSGQDVVKLQQRLYELEDNKVDKIDGEFGSKTESTVKKFQTNQGLEVDGIAGPQTLAILFTGNKSNNQFELGIDISHHNKQVNWQAVKNANISFVFVKATDGIPTANDNGTDPNFATNWQDVKKAGLIRGAYHFFRPRRSAQDQARHFLKTVNLEPNDLPPVLDIEPYPPEVGQQWKELELNKRLEVIKQWLQLVEAKTGRRPIIYTNIDFWNNYIGESLDFTHYPLWIANYKTYKPNVPTNNWGGNGYTFWQYTEKGKVDGIASEYVDLNTFKGSRNQLIALANGTSLAV